MAALLEVESLTKAFGGLVAVNGMSLVGVAGRGLGTDRSQRLGQDHAAQSHCRHRSGPDAGAIRMAGEDVTRLPNHLRVRKRINRTFQLVRAPANMPAIGTVMAGVLYGAGERVPFQGCGLRGGRSARRAQSADQGGSAVRSAHLYRAEACRAGARARHAAARPAARRMAVGSRARASWRAACPWSGASPRRASP